MIVIWNCANERKSKALASLNLYACKMHINQSHWIVELYTSNQSINEIVWNLSKIYLENISACDDVKMDKMEQHEALKVA